MRVYVSLEDIYNGVTKSVEFTRNVNGKEDKKTVKIAVPIGCPDNFKLVKRELGNVHDDLEPGNLVIVVTYEEHPDFKVSNNHLIIMKSIKYGTSMLGTKFLVSLPNKKEVNFDVDGPIFNDDIKVVHGMGLPDQNGDMGDLVVKFEVEKVLSFTKDQIKIIRSVFPLDKFVVGKCETVKGVTPSNEQEDDQSQEGNVQCAQS